MLPIVTRRLGVPGHIYRHLYAYQLGAQLAQTNDISNSKIKNSILFFMPIDKQKFLCQRPGSKLNVEVEGREPKAQS